MPIGISIIITILVILLIFYFIAKLSPEALGSIEMILIIGLVVVIGGVLLYITVLSFFDNAAATKLLKSFLECF